MAAAHADMSPALGYRVVGLENKDADEVVGGCADNCSMQGSAVGWPGREVADGVVGGSRRYVPSIGVWGG